MNMIFETLRFFFWPKFRFFANVVPNESLGFSRRYIQNVEDNSPVAAVLRLHVWTSTATDESIRDITGNTVNVLEAVTNVTEVNNTGYPATAPALDETDISIVVDDTGNDVDIDITDYTYTSISAGAQWDLVSLSYDDDGSDTDTNTEVMQVFDPADVVPNGGDITVNFPSPTLTFSQA